LNNSLAIPANQRKWAILFAVVACCSPLWLATATQAQTNPNLERLLTAKECQNCDLRGFDLSKYDLSDANLKGADLSGADLTGTILIGANLTRAKLIQTNLTSALLIGANISGANFQFANLQNASLYGAKARESVDFGGANMQGATLPDGRTNPPAVEIKK